MEQVETKLFDEMIFGPVKSRRLGLSLGINLLPTDSKLCNFDCIYCECGWTNLRAVNKRPFHTRQEVSESLERVLVKLISENRTPDTLTFAGNGEPTMHPEFQQIVDDVLLLRDRYSPAAMVAVLTNGVMLNKPAVVAALKRTDLAILKLDAGTEKLFQVINRPIARRTLSWMANHIQYLKGKVTIQTMFLKGVVNGKRIDNTAKKEVTAWLELIKEIQPELVMLYSLDRPTPEKTLQKIPERKLKAIAKRVEELGIRTLVS
jgi:wyosine [tRNA(Phe)-imidazoG37] synthetase (radical SAM superfamily)